MKKQGFGLMAWLAMCVFAAQAHAASVSSAQTTNPKPPSPPVVTPADPVTHATNLRSVHLRRRAECIKAANDQGISPTDQTLFVQNCLQK